MKKIMFFSLLCFVLFSCGSEDDICTSGEGTPRIKIKFKSLSNNKEIPLDTLYVNVDYGKGAVPVITKQAEADSALIPIRVDENSFTDIYVRLRKFGPESKIRINYTTKSQYVSPACGIKKTYQDLNSVLGNTNPVLKLEQTQNEITNEAKTSLYLDF